MQIKLPKLGWKSVVGVVGVVSFCIIAGMTAGINEIGERVVIRPIIGGEQRVIFDSGLYFKWGGKADIWPAAITVDYDKTAAPVGADVNLNGIEVQYRDGGNGSVWGNATIGLPNDKAGMIALVEKYKTPRGVAYNLVKPTIEATMNNSAGLIESEDAYATRRGEFNQQIKNQLRAGLIKTKVEAQFVTDAEGKETWKNVPIADLVDGKVQYTPGAFQNFGLTLVGIQPQKPTFEPKTQQQIEDKRDATMAVITAKANAARAKQDAITAEENGKKNVMTERYAQLVLKEAAVVKAEQIKEVAEIDAQRKVAVQAQALLEAKQFKLTAEELKQANILEGEGLAEKKRLIMEADGALGQKLDALVRIAEYNASAIAAQKQVPEIQFGTGDGMSSPSNDMLSMLAIKAAKDLNIDMTVK